MSLTIPPLFSGGAILPANKPLCVFGTGEGEIQVTLGTTTATATAKDGKWLACLPPMPYGGPYELTVTDGKTLLRRTDVYLGEVYLVAGQSNMQFKVDESALSETEYETDPLLRLYTVDRPEAGELFTSADGWIESRAETVGKWTAIGYSLGKALRKKKGVAIGIIACYQGASVIQSWLKKQACARPEFYVPDDEKFIDHRVKEYFWNAEGYLSEYMLDKLAPYPLTRVVWYQGESNTSNAESAIYDKLLIALIKQLRTAHLDETLPVSVVQIADLTSRLNDPEYALAWRTLQAKQAEVANTLENVKLIVSRDVCETDDIHPKTKKILAERIAKNI